MIMHKGLRILLIAALLAFIVPVFLGLTSLVLMGIGEDRTFHDDLYKAAEQAGNVLVQNNICTGVYRSCAGTIFFATASKGGGYVEIYGVNDRKVIDQFSKPFVDKFFEKNEMKKLWITSYAKKKGTYFIQSINFQIKMERK